MSSLNQRLNSVENGEAILAELEDCRLALAARFVPDNKRNVYGLKRLSKDLHQSTYQVIRPKKHIDIVEWAEKNLVVPKVSSPTQSGPLRLTNYQKAMLRKMVAGRTRFMVVPKSVQVGYSLMCVIAIFYALEHLEVNCAYVTRKDDAVDEWLKKFFNPFLEGNPILLKLKRNPKQDEDKDKLQARIFTNGTIFLARTAAADDSAREFTAWMVVCDEIDAETWMSSSAGQGSKLDMFRQRLTKYFDGRIVAGGSPTNMRTSNVEYEYAQTTQEEYFVPCPHCSGVIDPMTRRATVDVDRPAKLAGFQCLVEGNDDPVSPGIKFKLRESDHFVEEADYQCEFDMTHRIQERGPDKFEWRDWMDRYGEFRPLAPGGKWHKIDGPHEEWEQERQFTDPATGEVRPIPTNAMPGRVGTRVWAAYNPSVSWKVIITEKLAAKRKGQEGLKNYVNSYLGRAFEPHSSYAEQHASALEANCVKYPAPVPNDVIFLVAFVDAQHGRGDGSARKRLEVCVTGVGRENTAYFIAYYVIEVKPGGEVYDPDCEAKLNEVLDKTYKNEAGMLLKVFASGHDMGYEADRVRDYCRKHVDKRRIATKGHNDKTGVGTNWACAVNLTAGYNDQKAWRWYFIDTLRVKDELARKLAHGPRIGGIFFPQVAARLPGYFAGLTAERRNPYKQGWKWEVKTHDTPNEQLDTMVGCFAVRDWVLASSEKFADMDKIAAVLPWEVPLVPTMITHPWDGDDMSAQAAEHRPNFGEMAAGGISEQATQKIQQRHRVHPGLLKKPAPHAPGTGPNPAKLGPQVVAGNNQPNTGGGWSGRGGPKSGGWGS